MKSLSIVLLFLTAALSAEPARYIVEFKGGRRLMADDVAALRDAEPRLRVRREFKRALNGAAIEVADAASAQASHTSRTWSVSRSTPSSKRTGCRLAAPHP